MQRCVHGLAYTQRMTGHAALECCKNCDSPCPAQESSQVLNSAVSCRVALLLQHQLRGQCVAAVRLAAAAIAAIAVLVPQVEVEVFPLTPAGRNACIFTRVQS